MWTQLLGVVVVVIVFDVVGASMIVLQVVLVRILLNWWAKAGNGRND